MNILIVAYEFPYPPNHGGKADVWTRIKALKNKGANIFLLCWYGINKNEPLDENAIRVVKETVAHLEMIPIPRDIKRAMRLIKFPSLAAARILDRNLFNEVLEKTKIFKPDFVLIDGVYAGYTGLKFAKELDVPTCLRSHNIEHKYMLGQYKLVTGFRPKLAIIATILHLKKYENAIFKAVDAYFDISQQDLEFWKKKAYTNGFWLPPIFNKKLPPTENDTKSEEFDIGFIGNLYTPNNVNGLIWFIEEVLPLITKSVPQPKILIVGSNPNPSLLKVCEKVEGLSIISNPEFVEPYYEKMRLLINPVQFGSGMNIKAVEMLYSSKQVVSTSIGVKGIPAEINSVFYIADSAQEFANCILGIIQGSQSKDISLRTNLRNYFNENAVDELLSIMTTKTGLNNPLE